MLYQHQDVGAEWLAARRRGYLGDKPGLGKTRTALEAVRRAGAKRPAIVCPAIVRTHWAREAHGLDVSPSMIESYDKLLRSGAVPPHADALILDEAHYLKNVTAQRTKLLLGKKGLARAFDIVFPLSGTPISKNPAEVWPVLSALFPEVAVKYGLKTRADFIDRFCVVEQRWFYGRRTERILPQLKDEAAFKAMLSEFMLQRTLDDVGLDVPAIDWQLVYVDGARPTAQEMTTWGRTVPTFDGAPRDDLASIATDPHVASMRRRLGDLKAMPVVKMLRDQLADSDEKVVVFAHHRSVLAALREGLAEFGVAYVDGDTPQLQRQDEIDRFQDHPSALGTARVFLGQTIACQTGITLTAARRAVLVEPDWTAVVNHQAGHRIARIGQQADHVVVQMVALAGTLDEAIVAQNRRETALVGRIERKAA